MRVFFFFSFTYIWFRQRRMRKILGGKDEGVETPERVSVCRAWVEVVVVVCCGGIEGVGGGVGGGCPSGALDGVG